MPGKIFRQLPALLREGCATFSDQRERDVFLTGALTVLIRVFDPAHPEATLHAALLATLTVPLLDYLVVRRAWEAPAALVRGKEQ